MRLNLRSCVASTLLVAFAAGPGASASEVPFGEIEVVLELEVGANATPADLDGDGDSDLAVYSNGALVWLEQIAGGSPPLFVEHAMINQNAWTEFVPVDLDRDGDIDVALIYQNADDALVLAWAENDGAPGDGAWARRVVRTWDAPAFGFANGRGLVAADFDGDGDADLALAHQEHDLFASDPDGRLLWMRSDGSPGNGGWSEEPLYDWILDRTFNDLQACDLDGDGDLDLAGQSWDTDAGIFNGTSWWENDGSPGAGFWTRRIIDSTAISTYEDPQLAVGDLDGDGDLDVAVALAPDPPRWFESDGAPADGGWVEHEVVDVSLGSVFAFDFDRDGDLDLSGGDEWLDNDGSPANGGWVVREGPVGWFDLDGDGDVDALGAGLSDVVWAENLTLHRSARLRDASAISSVIDEIYDLAAGDVDGDGDLDLVSVSEAADRVHWHENRLEAGAPWLTRTVTDLADGARAVAAGDVDGDGDLDLVSASYNDDTVAWYENDGTPRNGGWTRRVISNGAGGAIDVALADFDRDGALDIACAQFLDDEVSWYRNDGATPPAFGALFVDSTPYDGPRSLAVGDFEGNGTPDLAVVSETGDTVVWYSNDGTPADGEWFRHRTDNGDVDAPRGVTAADLDRDGDLDLAVADGLGDAVAWYENDGSLAGWTRRTIVAACGGARALTTGDFDGDGDPDLLAACFDDDAIWLARNTGASPPGFISDPVTATANGVRALATADLDGDGDLDGAAAAGFADTVAWYENRGGQFQVVGTAIAADLLINDAAQGVLRAVVAHRGRAGDGQMELASVAVLLEEAPGDPLTAFQAASLIDFVRVFGDDGDGIFEPELDPLLAEVSPAGIDGSGVVWVDLADGSALAAVVALSQKTFFVGLDLADPFLFAAPRTLAVTLLTDGASVCEAEDRDHDIALALEWRANVSTATLAVLDVLFRDGFGTGDTSRWSVVFP